MESKRVRVTKTGRVQIPQEFLDAIGRNKDEPVILILEDDNSLRVLSHGQSIAETQAMWRSMMPEEVGKDMVEDVLEWRREQRKLENEKWTRLEQAPDLEDTALRHA